MSQNRPAIEAAVGRNVMSTEREESRVRVLIIEHNERISASLKDAISSDAEEMSSARLIESALRHEWTLDRLEREYIRAVLKRTQGHRGRAAEILGVDRRTLYRKLKHTGAEGGEAR